MNPTIADISKYLISQGLTSWERRSSQEITGPASIDKADKGQISWLLAPDPIYVKLFQGSLLIVAEGRGFGGWDERTLPCKHHKLAMMKVCHKFFEPKLSYEYTEWGNLLINTEFSGPEGKEAIIAPGCIIGGEGFGFERDLDDEWIQFPHYGGVKIGKNVEIGQGVNIQRGVFDNTIISDGCKIWHGVNIGHNCYIGKRSVILNNSVICGSVHVSANVWIAPNATVMNKMSIGHNSVIGIGSVVTKNIPENEVWAGNPARKIGNRDEYSHIMRSHR